MKKDKDKKVKEIAKKSPFVSLEDLPVIKDANGNVLKLGKPGKFKKSKRVSNFHPWR